MYMYILVTHMCIYAGPVCMCVGAIIAQCLFVHLIGHTVWCITFRTNFNFMFIGYKWVVNLCTLHMYVCIGEHRVYKSIVTTTSWIVLLHVGNAWAHLTHIQFYLLFIIYLCTHKKKRTNCVIFVFIEIIPH